MLGLDDKAGQMRNSICASVVVGMLRVKCLHAHFFAYGIPFVFMLDTLMWSVNNDPV